MPLVIRCTNSACGKAMRIKDELVGRKVRCPACGSVIETPPNPALSEKSPKAPSPPSKTHKSQLGHEDDDEEQEVTDDYAPKLRGNPNPTKDQRTRRSVDVQDEAEEQFEPDAQEEEKRPRPKKRRRKQLRSRARAEDDPDPILLGVAILLLVGLGLSPLLPWVSMKSSGSVLGMNLSASISVNGFGRTWVSGGVSGPQGNVPLGGPQPKGMPAAPAQQPPSGKAWEGWTILGVSAGFAILVGLALAMHVSTQFHPRQAENVVTLFATGSGGWAVMAGIWLVAYIWKAFVLSSRMSDQIETAKKSFPRGMGGGFDVSASAIPSFGLWVGLLLALAVAILCGALVARRNQSLWTLGGSVIGLIGGILMLTIHVKPWTAMQSPNASLLGM